MNQAVAVGEGDGGAATVDEWKGFVTVDEAASLLRVSHSTLWRWLKAGVLPAYRIGGRRVWLRQTDLAGLVKRAIVTPKEGGSTVRRGRVRERGLADGERQQMMAAVEAAARLQASLLEARGGRLFRPAHEEIAEARRERSASRE
jgi:excisionase family DNA binding protein